MIDNSNNVVHSQQSETDLAAPRFDNKACANAQPVVPIPTSRISRLIQRLPATRHSLNVKSKALALVVIAGLAAGALGGTLLVKQKAPNTDEASFNSQPVDEGIAGGAQGVIEANSPAADAVMGTPVKSRSLKRQRRGQMPGPPRAYQVDVLR